MPNEPNPFIGVVPDLVDLHEVGTSVPSQQGLQPVTVGVEGVPHSRYYMTTEPEYMGAFPMQTDLVTLPERNPFGHNPSILSNLDLEVINSDIVAHSWVTDPTLQSDSVLYISEPNQDITFYSRDQVESLRLGANGDFFVQGRLVANDLEVYQAFRKFLGLSCGLSVPEPEPRDGIETRYQRILKKAVGS